MDHRDHRDRREIAFEIFLEDPIALELLSVVQAIHHILQCLNMNTIRN